MRKSCSRLIYVNVTGALRDGIGFVHSANGVVLTPGIDVCAARGRH